MGVSVVVDPRKGPPMVVNASGVELDSIAGALRASDEPMVAALVEWSKQSQRPGRYGGTFERDRFVTPYSTFEQIMTAREAIHDDVVGAVADETEALLYDDLGFFADDEAEQDIWNQWAEDIDLHTRLREIWRTTFTDSQVAITAWWGRKTYTPRIKTGAGVAHRKTYDLVVPTALTQIDSTKVAPVGSLMYGRERLSYLADGFEAGIFDQVIGNRALLPPLQTLDPGYHSPLLTDPLVERLIEKRYLPDWGEQFRLARDGINTHNLFLIKEDAVFRHTLTRPPYQRFSDVRMKSVFQLLDLKEQLRQMDRAFLIGGQNFLIVVTKGTDQHPAEPTEIEQLREQFSVVARVPVIVGDHRLKIEIVTPKVDATLNYEKYDTLDLRIAARLYQTFIATDRERTRDPVKLGKVISQGLTAKRADLARTLEYQLFRRIRMLNPQLKSRARLIFSPQQISLSFDPDWASFVFDLRAANELSRQSSLSAFGFDQSMEAVLRQREARDYDATFNTLPPAGVALPAPEELVPPNPKLGGDPKVKVPAPDLPANDPGAGMRNRSATRSGGRQGGGTRNGGGADGSPGSRQGKEPLGRRSRAARQTEEDDQ